MHDVICISDEITAIGFRLAGVHSIVPDKAELVETIDGQRANCRVMILTADLFDALPQKMAADLQNAGSPLLAIVPDARGLARVPDMERQVKQALRIEV